MGVKVPKERGMRIELLACWLNQAARSSVGGHAAFRQVIRQATIEAREFFCRQEELTDDEPGEISDDYGVLDTLARFAQAVDEDERRRLEEENPEPRKE